MKEGKNKHWGKPKRGKKIHTIIHSFPTLIVTGQIIHIHHIQKSNNSAVTGWEIGIEQRDR